MDSRFSFLAIYFLFINCQAKRSSQTETFYGEVGASNYTYYRFDGEKEMKLILTLTTVQGDADLYVGGQRSKPTFDLDQHHFQSTTCGRVDEVVVPASFVRDERPIGIGIYGHPSHAISRYILDVIAEEVEIDENNGYLEDDDHIGGSRRASEEDEENNDERDSKSIISWEIVISLLAAIVRILIDVLT